MKLQEWLNKYNKMSHFYKTDVNREVNTGLIINELKTALSEKNIIMYGAGTVGRNFYRLMNEMGIEVAYIIDKKCDSIGNLNGKNVHGLNWLKNNVRNIEDYVIVVTTNRELYPEIRSEIVNSGFTNADIICGHDLHMIAQASRCMQKAEEGKKIELKNCYECTNLDNTCESLKQYLKRSNGFIDKGTGTYEVSMIGYALGNVCTLKCKCCCESVPYVPASMRKVTPTQNVINDIQHLSKACNFLTLLEFVGGEPFLHQGLPEILRASLAISNIGIIHIFTNGTVVPSDLLCETLQNERITVYISNYQATLSDEHLKKIQQTKEKLEKYNVNYFFGKKQGWSDFSEYECVKTDDEVERGFSACFLHNCNRLQDGVLYVCPHQYGGIKLGKLEECGETIHIHEYSPEELEKELHKFKGLKKIDACKYCTLPFKAKPVISGEQL